MTVSPDEAARLATLADYRVLDTPNEPVFDAMVARAAEVVGTPIAMVSLVDADRQWFKAALGVTHREAPVQGSFCRETVNQGEVLVVPDAAADIRFKDSAFVTQGDKIRFYAGAPLQVANGARLGTLCVIDTVPRDGLSAEEEAALKLLARRTVAALELRRTVTPAGLDRAFWLDQAADLLGQASAALERTGEAFALAQLDAVIAAVDDLRTAP